MKISIKTEQEIQKMRIAGKLASEVLEMIEPFVVPGVSTEELDKKCHEHIVNVQKAIPANVGYRGFEKTICASVNQVICHGIPDKNKILKDGDILNIDVTALFRVTEILLIPKPSESILFLICSLNSNCPFAPILLVCTL